MSGCSPSLAPGRRSPRNRRTVRCGVTLAVRSKSPRTCHANARNSRNRRDRRLTGGCAKQLEPVELFTGCTGLTVPRGWVPVRFENTPVDPDRIGGGRPDSPIVVAYIRRLGSTTTSSSSPPFSGSCCASTSDPSRIPTPRTVIARFSSFRIEKSGLQGVTEAEVERTVARLAWPDTLNAGRSVKPSRAT